MFAEQTPAVARALEAAHRWAQVEGAAALTPRHLLLGLLDETEGRAAKWLAGHGFDGAAWLSKQPAAPARSESAPSPLPNDPGAGEVASQARGLARTVTVDRIVTTDHLILAILRTDSQLRQELASAGLRVEELEREWQAAHTAPVELEAPLDLESPVEQSDTARILDASANRAREALRVLEDYCRFALDDSFLSRELKELRHELAAALTELPPAALLTARDTLADVGTDISTQREQVRHSAREVVQANLKRLQEALRSLEEYGKLYGSDLGQRLERLRYQSYTLERAILLGAGARGRLTGAKLYVLLSGASCRYSLERTIADAADGGADIIQLREKTLPDRELLARAREVRGWTRQAGVVFIVNDRPDIARLCDADGVHLGQDDVPVRAARRVLGPDALIGVSTHDIEQVRRAVLDGASYIGVGPTFPSRTKDFADLAGLEFVRAATAETTLPAFVLGGVTAANVGQVVVAGGKRVAVSAAIAQADDPRAAARALRAALQ
jgi:thiamine-phosphate pyrophosphorylase